MVFVDVSPRLSNRSLVSNLISDRDTSTSIVRGRSGYFRIGCANGGFLQFTSLFQMNIGIVVIYPAAAAKTSHAFPQNNNNTIL